MALLFTALFFGLQHYGALPDISPFNRHVDNPDRAVCSGQVAEPSYPDTFVFPSMLDASELLGEPVPMKTFGLTVGDINGDYRDDIVLGSHAFLPRLLLNTGTDFEDASAALDSPDLGRRDTHAYTLADLDNDGDLDLAITSGGADGVGEGSPNMLFRNDSLKGNLVLTEMSPGDEYAMSRARSRAFIPLASSDGSKVDLYFTALLRDGYPNRLLRNTGSTLPSSFLKDEKTHLPRKINDHGRGVIADFDGDKKHDYLLLENDSLNLYWHPDSGRDVLTLSKRVFSLSVADLNNDGSLDIFAGRIGDNVRSDRISYTKEKLIYVVRNSRSVADKSIFFATDSAHISLDLRQHIRQTEKRLIGEGEDIYIGRNLRNPDKRHFKLHRLSARGEPNSFDAPGIYIWYSGKSGGWHVRWRFYPEQESFRGLIKATGIASLQERNIEKKAPGPVSDLVFFNRGGGHFKPTCSVAMDHQSATTSATVADFNNDGWLDIAGVRHADPGAENPQAFLLTNVSGRDFVSEKIKRREADRLARSDHIAHGFFDGDNKPDIIITNGFGQPPSNKGLARLLLNSTATEADAIVLRLAGANANRFGIGAKLTLRDRNGRILGYRIQGLNTNVSQDTHWIHFGLGSAQSPYSLSIDWPDGSRSDHELSDSGRYVLRQGEDGADSLTHHQPDQD